MTLEHFLMIFFSNFVGVLNNALVCDKLYNAEIRNCWLGAFLEMLAFPTGLAQKFFPFFFADCFCNYVLISYRCFSSECVLPVLWGPKLLRSHVGVLCGGSCCWCVPVLSPLSAVLLLPSWPEDIQRQGGRLTTALCQYKDGLTKCRIYIVKIRLSGDHLIFIMGISLPIRQHLYTETVLRKPA